MVSSVAGPRKTIPLIATTVVLLALLGDKLFLRMSPAQADSYHATVKSASEALPMAFGSWLGLDVPVPEAAVRMLHPNKIISRQYRNIATDETVNFLLVHVRDARDILGHYPPICYPGQGWKMDSKSPMDWSREMHAVAGTEYQFTRDRMEGNSRLIVDNFLITRGGLTYRDMDGVELAAQDRQRKFFGAGQVQIVHGSATSPERRRQIVEEFLKFLEPTLQAISDGQQHEQQ